MSELPLRYCYFHKEVQITLKAEESISQVKKDNDASTRFVLTPALSKDNWRFYFIGECTECNWETKAKVAGIPTGYCRCSFNNFKCDEENLDSIVERVKSYANNPHGFLLLKGGYGTGKTHLGVSVLRELRETSLSFKYITHLNLIREYCNFLYRNPNTNPEKDPEDDEDRIAYMEDGRVKHKIQSRYEFLQGFPLLCVDEFGDGKGNEDERLKTFEIFDYRFRESLSTILLTNFTTEQLKDIIDPRLLDRIEEALYANLNLGFSSKRKSMNSQYLEKASK